MIVDKILKSDKKRVKAAFGLALAEMVIDSLKPDKEGYLIAREALNLCWDWVETEGVSGATLSGYVDGPSEKDLGVREGYYNGNQVMISALVVLTLAIGLTSRFAYESTGEKNMPTPIWETDSDSLRDATEYASKTPLYNHALANQVEDFLINLNESQNIKREKILNIVYREK